jgi:hypothetical protein
MMLIRGTARRAGKTRSSGQAMVEFALVAPMLFLLILGAIEAGRFVFYYEALNNAAREGARYAIVHGENSTSPSGPLPNGKVNHHDPTGSQIVARVREAALELATIGELIVHDPVWTNRQQADIHPSPGDASTGTNARGEYVTVFVDYTYRPLVAAVVDVGVLPDITISAESTLVINW